VKHLRKYYGLFALVSYLIFMVSPAPGASSPISLADYWQKIEQTQALVAGLEDTPNESDQTQLLTLADEWEGITEVVLLDRTIIPVNHSFLVSQLRAEPPNYAQLNGLLTNLLAVRTTWPDSIHTSSDLKILKDILARPEFQWQSAQPSLLAVLWQRILQYIWKLLSYFIPEQAIITINGVWFRYLMTGLASLLLALVLFFMLRELLADFVTDANLDLDPETGQEILTADTALKHAQKLSGEGDYRTAVRYLYLSSLLLLDERGLLRYNRSQTNREYLRSVAHLPILVAILREVIEVFDRVWYGYQPLDEATYNQYAARVAELRQQK